MATVKPNFKYELEKSSNYEFIAGVDEVGRGSLAGPIVAAAVIFTDYKKIKKELKAVDDSKKLTEKDRKELDIIIRNFASDFAIGEVDVLEIDKYGIGAANITAFKRALDQLENCDFALIDGRKFRGFEYEYLCLEKGESKSISIAAASIIAKVYRDNLMQKLGGNFTEYNFASNKGYACDKHCNALREIGPTIHHRKTFLRWLGEEKESQSLF